MTTQAVPEGKYADIGGGLRVHYHEQGTGLPVIFIHGSGPGASGWSNFRRNYPALAGAGLRVLVPDLLGYGYSSMPPKITWEEIVGGVRGFARALGIERCALVGNSMGGAIAIQLALDEPGFVQKLVLMAPGGLEEREVYMQMRGIRTMLKAMYAPEGFTRESMSKVFSLQLFDPKLITDEIVEERYQIAVTQPKGMFESLIVPNLAPRVAELACPILGFWGVNDRFTPLSGATTIATRCRNVRMTMLSECGHWVMVEHAEFFNRQCVEFLVA